ncbi:lytic transglycosylase domain-containing protein [Rhodobacteraceae bacterium NNCM2]|nr:lytic transglycosylase domain-containing protein [Coraliihabitans acroporae]
MRLLGLIACALILTAFSARPGLALDLDEARRSGMLVASALGKGADGDWDGAQAMVATSDPVVQDIVLWRKLRARKGSYAEYQSYVSRRPTWPGQTQLEEIYVGKIGSGGSGGLSAQAAANWRAFLDLYGAKKYDDATIYLAGVSGSIEQLGSPPRWADRRRRLARRAAREGNGQLAYQVASQHYLSAHDGYNYSDLEWISGWVALTQLQDPGRAAGHFERFAASVETPISRGRAGYWVGRSYEALGDQAKAREWYKMGAEHQTSFYGQLAAAKIDAPGDVALTENVVGDWNASPAMQDDDVRMAAIMHYANQEQLAFATFSALSKRLTDRGELAALGALTLELQRPHYAVRVAKSAARRGVVLPSIYYPNHALSGYATKVEPAFAMSIARQETELNPEAVSPAGARGLMQLMPATAKKVAGWIDEPYSKSRLTQDWQYNARLGQTYLARRTDQFGGSYVMAAAAYNAGAGRVDQWLAQNGDPRLPGSTTEDMIDWMENIPFRETRNYVQRVMEGLYVYRARLSGTAGPMTIEQDLARGVR